MSIFIKPGFWEEKKLAPKHWLNLNQLITKVVETLTPTTSYKVFTALLLQSGSNEIEYIGEGDLVIGVTYRIGYNGETGDWTNVGAPNNDIGTYFIATGEAPASWGDGGELEINTGAPTAMVIENTIGNVWFNYINEGRYGFYSSSLFVNNKTFSPNSSTINYSVITGSYVLKCIYQNNNLVNISTSVTSDGSPLESCLDNKFIEIRVYN